MTENEQRELHNVGQGREFKLRTSTEEDMIKPRWVSGYSPWNQPMPQFPLDRPKGEALIAGLELMGAIAEGADSVVAGVHSSRRAELRPGGMTAISPDDYAKHMEPGCFPEELDPETGAPKKLIARVERPRLRDMRQLKGEPSGQLLDLGPEPKLKVEPGVYMQERDVSYYTPETPEWAKHPPEPAFDEGPMNPLNVAAHARANEARLTPREELDKLSGSEYGRVGDETKEKNVTINGHELTDLGKDFVEDLITRQPKKTYPMCAECGGPNCDCTP